MPAIEGAPLVVTRVVETAASPGAWLPGDQLLRWRPDRSASPRPFESILTWIWLEAEYGPRGTVEVELERGSERWWWRMHPTDWTPTIEPKLEVPLADLIEAGRASLGNGDEKSAAAFGEGLDPDLRTWLWLRIGEAEAQDGAISRADLAYHHALEWGERPIARWAVLERLGRSAQQQGRFDEARQIFERGLDLSRKHWGESLLTARFHALAGGVEWYRERLDQAEPPLARALEIRQRLAPNSLDLAASLNQIGALAWVRGQVDKAADYYQDALAIRQNLAPESLLTAGSLNNLGNVAWARGDLEESQTLLQQALDIKESLDPASLDVALTLTNLGNVAAVRGYFDEAESFYQGALGIQQRLAPGSLEVSRTLTNLGNIESQRGNVELAVHHYRQALSLAREQAADSLYVSRSLSNLAHLELRLGRRVQGRKQLEEAFDILTRQAPGGREYSMHLNDLGDLDLDEGRPQSAHARHRKALEIQERQAPGTLDSAFTHGFLAEAENALGNFEASAAHHRRSVELFQQRVPNSIDAATASHRYGTFLLERGHIDEAAQAFEHAVVALEEQLGRLGGANDLHSRYRARHQTLYRSWIDALNRLGRPRDAFVQLERSRARGFLRLLAERDLRFSLDLPPELDRQRRNLLIQLERTHDELLQPGGPDSSAEPRQTLRSLRREYDALMTRARQRSPRFAALHDPQTLDADQAAASLAPGTLLLAFSLGHEEGDVYLLERGRPLDHYRFAVGTEALEEDVRRWRQLIREMRPGSPRAAGRQQIFDQIAQRLFTQLLDPAISRIAAAERLLILPDGPLHELPWSALRPDAERYLASWKPVHLALSATVHGQITARPSPPAHRALDFLAFADPPPGKGADRLPPLPASRHEVQRLAEFFPPERRAVKLGQAASEASLWDLAPTTEILHVATHVIPDEHLPLHSAMLLTPSTEPESSENGRLEVWELFERLRLDADLVVLSACGSALGAPRQGEGLIGLTRAFQHAGARSVLATLWNIDDATTTELMSHFYKAWLGGIPKDEALRRAQHLLITQPLDVQTQSGNGSSRSVEASSPYFWAAFQLYGDAF